MKIRNLLATLTLTIGITMAALPMTSYSQTQDNVVSAKVQSSPSENNSVISMSFQTNASLSVTVSWNNISRIQSTFTLNPEKYLLMGFIGALMALAIFLFL